MTKHVSKIMLTLAGVLLTVSLVAQSQKNTGADSKAADKTKAKKPKIPTYLGRSDMASGMIGKRVFDSLLVQGVTAKDSAGRPYKVVGFVFNYGERNLYEDSVGNPMILTDYLGEYIEGDTLSTFLKQNITERSKPGDTVIIEQITLRSPEGYGAEGKSMKFVLKK